MISSRLGVFPGDQPFTRKLALDFDQGHHLRLSGIQTTLHIGAHADSSGHYHKDGKGIEARDVAVYLGRAQVVHVKSGTGRIQKQDLPDLKILAPRVLFSTGSFPNPEKWNSDFRSFAPEFLTWLAEQGVKLVGIDTPSVDPEDSKSLESHQVLFHRNIAVLEGLILSHVPDGVYTLIAPPLPIEGADASPVRALLHPNPDLIP